MDDLLYRDVILDHWKHPQNYGVITNANMQIRDENPLCGDEMYITAIIENDMIKKIQFTSTGCAISKASASILTEYAKNKSKKDIQSLSQETFLKLLEIQLTPVRLKCALLSYSALQKGLNTLSL